MTLYCFNLHTEFLYSTVNKGSPFSMASRQNIGCIKNITVEPNDMVEPLPQITPLLESFVKCFLVWSDLAHHSFSLWENCYASWALYFHWSISNLPIICLHLLPFLKFHHKRGSEDLKLNKLPRSVQPADPTNVHSQNGQTANTPESKNQSHPCSLYNHNGCFHHPCTCLKAKSKRRSCSMIKLHTRCQNYHKWLHTCQCHNHWPNVLLVSLQVNCIATPPCDYTSTVFCMVYFY